MRKLIPSHTTADSLLGGDRFKMAGEMYVVLRVHKNFYGDTIIDFAPFFGRPGTFMTLITRKSTKFKVYTEK